MMNGTGDSDRNDEIDNSRTFVPPSSSMSSNSTTKTSPHQQEQQEVLLEQQQQQQQQRQKPPDLCCSTSSSLFLPPELLQRCLSLYCDPQSIEMFMIATTTTTTTTTTMPTVILPSTTLTSKSETTTSSPNTEPIDKEVEVASVCNESIVPDVSHVTISSTTEENKLVVKRTTGSSTTTTLMTTKIPNDNINKVKVRSLSAHAVVSDAYFRILQNVLHERIQNLKETTTTTTTDNHSKNSSRKHYNDSRVWLGLDHVLRICHNRYHNNNDNDDNDNMNLNNTSSNTDNKPDDHHLLLQKEKWERKQQHQLFLLQLHVLDFFETCPTLVWTGWFRFYDPTTSIHRIQSPHNGNGSNGSGVLVRTTLTMLPNSWSIDHVYSWWSLCRSSRNITTNYHDRITSSNHSQSTTTTTTTGVGEDDTEPKIDLTMEPYNFIPIRPRGVIRGCTRHDNDEIRRIAVELDSQEYVATLKKKGGSSSSSLILRIISYPQARRRLMSLYSRRQISQRPQRQMGGDGRNSNNNNNNVNGIEHPNNGSDENNNDSTEFQSLSPALKVALETLDDDMGFDDNEDGAKVDVYSALVCCWESEQPWEEESSSSSSTRPASELLSALESLLLDFKATPGRIVE